MFPSPPNSKTRQDARDFSMWNIQTVKLLRLLISDLSDTATAWNIFQRKEIGYFLDDSELGGPSSSLKNSLNAVDDVFLDLKGLRQKLQGLRNELCEDNPQGVSIFLLWRLKQTASV